MILKNTGVPSVRVVFAGKNDTESGIRDAGYKSFFPKCQLDKEISLPLPIIFNTIIIMKNGKVKFFNESKGFGFIVENETGKEYFVHASGLIDRVRDNDDVTFDLTEGRKGLNAVNVKLLQA